MRRFAILSGAAAVVALSIGRPPAAEADPAKSVCIPAYQIDHTDTPDDWTILFHMRNHKVWKAALINQCVGLKINSRGFTYTPTDPGSDEICSNLLTIRLNDTGQTCLVGAITPVEPAAAKGSAAAQ
jgi:hypothetical protein